MRGPESDSKSMIEGMSAEGGLACFGAGFRARFFQSRPSGTSDVPASRNQRDCSVVTWRESTTLIARAAASLVAGRIDLEALSEGARQRHCAQRVALPVGRWGTIACPARPPGRPRLWGAMGAVRRHAPLFAANNGGCQAPSPRSVEGSRESPRPDVPLQIIVWLERLPALSVFGANQCLGGTLGQGDGSIGFGNAFPEA